MHDILGTFEEGAGFKGGYHLGYLLGGGSTLGIEASAAARNLCGTPPPDTVYQFFPAPNSTFCSGPGYSEALSHRVNRKPPKRMGDRDALAEATGIAQATLFRIASGKADPRASALDRLGDYFLGIGYRFEMYDGYECVCVPRGTGDS